MAHRAAVDVGFSVVSFDLHEKIQQKLFLELFEDILHKSF
jgi:hypothetical protein